MPIETETTTTATTKEPDEKILAEQRKVADAALAAAAFRAGDIVETGDPAVIERCRLLKPWGVVASFDPFDKTARVVCTDINGIELPLMLTASQITLRT
jgi:hypothetical protein